MKKKKLLIFIVTMLFALGLQTVAYAGTESGSASVTAPANCKAKLSGKRVKLTWKAPKGAERYEVYRSTSKKTGYKRIKKTTETSFTDNKGKVGKTYYYKIYAVSKGKKKAGRTMKVTIKPDTVKKLKISTSNKGSAVLKWSKVSSADSYQIYRSTKKNSGFKKIGVWTKNTFTDSKMAAGTTYYYRVFAVKNKVKSNAASISYTTVKSVKLNKTSITLKKGNTYQLSAVINPKKTTDRTITWSSSNKSVARVSKSGKVTAVGSGSAIITARTSNGKKAACKVKVKIAQPGEMKAVWISYLDMQTCLKDRNEVEFRSQVSSMMKSVKGKGLNTVIVQVRAFSDAIYPSGYYPWASYITSSAGGPGYDPLKIMIDTAHDNGLSFQAWINPYRTSFTSVADPASESVRNRIVNGVAEIVKKYDVEGIHFDDYFYASSDTTSQAEKMNNVNQLIRQVYSKINSIDASVVFGISPAGNLEYAKSIGCDIDTWLSNSGYVDYICPQLYWSDTYIVGGTTKQMYSDRLKEWVAINKNNTRMYVGLALYKAGASVSSSWGTDAGWSQQSNNLATQYRKAISSGTDGYAVFRYDYLFTSAGSTEMSNLKNVSR